MTTKIDDLLSARFQASCLNYNDYYKRLFDEQEGIEKYLSFSLQFSSISMEQKELLAEHSELPANIIGYISAFDGKLTDDEYSNPKYAYRILFVPKTVNHKGQADKVIEFVKSDSPLAEKVNANYVFLKETEKAKYLPAQVIDSVHKAGYVKFTMHNHTALWKDKDAKSKSKGYGVLVAEKSWHWYKKWVDEVIDYCKQQGDRFRE